MINKLTRGNFSTSLAKQLVKAFSLAAIGMCVAGFVQARPWLLDTTFGLGGKVIGDKINAPAIDFAVQSDGKIVAVGHRSDASGGHFFLTRYSQNGSIDSAFGVNGSVNTANDVSSIDAAVAIQPDGKILAATYGWNGFTLGRYNSDGSVDSSFRGTGKVTTAANTSADTAVIAIQSDGKILATWPSSTGVTMVRLNANGSFDLSFGDRGSVALPGFSFAILVQPDNKIVVAGYYLVRFNVNGSVDKGFGTAGLVEIPGTAAAALQSDGKIDVAVSDQILRFNADGFPDTAFGVGGIVQTPFDLSSLRIQPDGKILALGATGDTDGGFDFALVRYYPNGSRNTTFGDGGFLVTHFDNSSILARSMAFDAEGRLVVGGTSSTSLVFARILPTPDELLPQSISGNVQISGGRGLKNATVSMTGPGGLRRTVVTSSLGYYIFDNLIAGQLYTLSVQSKVYRFAVKQLQSDAAVINVDFVGME